MIKEDLKKLLKEKEFIVDFERAQNGTDDDGYPTYKIEYINPPKNFKLVKFIDGLNCVILEDLTVIEEQTAL